MAIDIGSVPGDWVSYLTAGYTAIEKSNPANEDGTITAVQFWVHTNIVGLRVGTFYTTNGDTLKCRDSATLGDFAAGEHEATEDSGAAPLAIEVKTGDYIGLYWPDTGAVKLLTTGGAVGIWNIPAEEHIDPGDEAAYSYAAGYQLALGGTGVTTALGKSRGHVIG